MSICPCLESLPISPKQTRQGLKLFSAYSPSGQIGSSPLFPFFLLTKIVWGLSVNFTRDSQRSSVGPGTSQNKTSPPFRL